MDIEDAPLGGRYRLGALLGVRGPATVYAADDVRLLRRVEVRVYRPMPDEPSQSRFAAETRLLAGLSHRGLVTVYDVSLDACRPYLVTRLVDGATLGELADRGPLAPLVVARLGAQVADVLAYLHGRGVAHRAVTPSAVRVDEEGDGFLTDLTPTAGGDGPALDVHALGVLLLACVGDPRRLGPRWRAVLTAMTAPDPGDRPTAARCATMLTAIAGGEPVVQVPAPAQLPAGGALSAEAWTRRLTQQTPGGGH